MCDRGHYSRCFDYVRIEICGNFTDVFIEHFIEIFTTRKFHEILRLRIVVEFIQLCGRKTK